jgi:hypothetical protein
VIKEAAQPPGVIAADGKSIPDAVAGVTGPFDSNDLSLERFDKRWVNSHGAFLLSFLQYTTSIMINKAWTDRRQST